MIFQRLMIDCRRIAPALAGGLWLSCVFVVVALAMLLFMPMGGAAPIVVDDQFDFALGPQGWTPTPVAFSSSFLPPSGNRWKHDANNSNRWTVASMPVSGTFAWTGNHLTSGTINIDPLLPPEVEQIDTIRLSLVHAFNLPRGSLAYPIATGQITYSINGGPFLGISGTSFQQGTVASVDAAFPTANPTWSQYVSPSAQTLVTPTYTPASGLPLLVPGGLSFTGTSTNYFSTLVPTVAVLSFPTSLTLNSLQIRLTNANFASNCPADAGWQVALVQADFYALPEPGTVAMAAGAGLIAAVRGWRQRRRCVTSGPPARA